MEFATGGLAAVCAGFFTNPLEVVKTRLQLQGELRARGMYAVHYRGFFHAFSAVARADGLLALQKGLVPGLWYQLALNGTRLGLYQAADDRGWTRDPAGHVSLLKAGTVAAVTGCAGGYVGSPFYLVKTHLQAQAADSVAVGHQHGHSGMTQGLRHVYQQHGVAGLWRGVLGAMPRSAVGSFSQLVSFAYCKQWLSRYQVRGRSSNSSGCPATRCVEGPPAPVAVPLPGAWKVLQLQWLSRYQVRGRSSSSSGCPATRCVEGPPTPVAVPLPGAWKVLQLQWLSRYQVRGRSSSSSGCPATRCVEGPPAPVAVPLPGAWKVLQLQWLSRYQVRGRSSSSSGCPATRCVEGPPTPVAVPLPGAWKVLQLQWLSRYQVRGRSSNSSGCPATRCVEGPPTPVAVPLPGAWKVLQLQWLSRYQVRGRSSNSSGCPATRCVEGPPAPVAVPLPGAWKVLQLQWLSRYQVFQENPLLNSFASSMTSGVSISLCMTPADVIMTRLYNQGVDANGKGLLYKGVWDCAVKIWRSEGIYGFYKGLVPSYVRLGPHTVLCFVFWDFFKDLERKTFHEEAAAGKQVQNLRSDDG
ncbi:solute carrier family 25 member 35-like isoform X2 [Bacillus rossius redtenbacheri]|uniref:solute carrier family 25 member 35-like isoform X2 n=1 Tax=Bacillus rossius redtenbacheri TaxID=93214 RepID=UPI002FDE4C16